MGTKGVYQKSDQSVNREKVKFQLVILIQKNKKDI